MDKYEMIIWGSDEDDAFVVDIPELPGCMAHGSTHEEAMKNAKDAMEFWLDCARKDNDPIPKPKGRRLVFA